MKKKYHKNTLTDNMTTIINDDTINTINSTPFISSYTYGDSFDSTLKHNTTIEVGNLQIDNVVVINKLINDINQIKKSLLLLSRDVSMEEKYPELKQAYEQYNSILKRLTAMEILAEDDDIE